MLKALITGGCGFIGYNLVLALESDPWQAWDVIVIDDLSSGLRSNHVNGVDYIHESILKEGLLDSVVSKFMPDVIFHLAAIPRVSFSVKHPVETFNANVLGTLKVLEAVRKSKLPHSCRIVNTSSSSIYGDSAPRPTHRLTPGNPQSPYALDKWQAEEWCRMYAKLYNLDVVSLRYFNVFGPHSRFGGAYSTVMSAWLYSLFVDPSVTPYLEGDGLQSRDFCITGDSQILSADLTNKSAKDVRVGDELVSFSETPVDGKRFFSKSKVTRIHKYVSNDMYKITFSDESTIKCTGNHAWLSPKGFKRTDEKYKFFQKYNFVSGIRSLFKVQKELTLDEVHQYDLGYIAGSIDGDGTIGKYSYETGDVYSCKLTATDKEFVDYFALAMNRVGMEVKRGTYQSKYPGSKIAYIARTAKKTDFDFVSALFSQEKFADESFCKGYMAAMFDGEGERTDYMMRLSNSDDRIISNLELILQRFNFDFSVRSKNKDIKYISILGGLVEHLRFYSLFRYKISRKIPILEDREVKVCTKEIRAIEKTAPCEVFVIELDNDHTYVVDGLFSHNCFVENVVKANLLCQSHIARFKGESFNVAQGQSHTLLQLKEIIEQATGKIIELEYRPERIGDVKHTLADITDTCNILGYDPKRDFVNQVKIMADWYATSYTPPQI